MNAAASVEEVRRYCRCEAERRATDGGKVQSPVLANSRRSLRNPENGKSDPLAPLCLPQGTVHRPVAEELCCSRSDRLLPHQNHIIAGSMNANMPWMARPRVCPVAMRMQWPYPGLSMKPLHTPLQFTQPL